VIIAIIVSILPIKEFGTGFHEETNIIEFFDDGCDYTSLCHMKK